MAIEHSETVWPCWKDQVVMRKREESFLVGDSFFCCGAVLE